MINNELQEVNFHNDLRKVYFHLASDHRSLLQ